MIEHLRENVNIIEYISQYVELVEKGSNHVGLCPFHHDNNPSFKVSKTKNIFKCFSCGKSGNIFNFVMLYHKVSFHESLNILSSYLNVDFIEPHQELYDFVKVANHYFIEGQSNQRYIDYLNKRKISIDVAKNFQVGFIDSNYVPQEFSKYEHLINLGIIAKFGDKLKLSHPGCLTFPFLNSHGKVTGFSFMPIDRSSDQAKYVNSWGSDIFHKRELFFGNKGRIEGTQCILVEGYFDVLRLGPTTENPLAVCTTTVTPEQIKKLDKIRYTLLAFDGDEAGRQGAIKSSILLEEAGHDVLIADFPDGEDPDSFFLLADGDSPLLNIYDFCKKYYVGSNFVDYIASHVGKLKNPSKVDDYFRKLHFEFPNIPTSLLNSIILNSSNKSNVYSKPTFSLQEEVLKYTFIGEIDPSLLDIDKFDKDLKLIVESFKVIYNQYEYIDAEGFKSINKLPAFLFNEPILLPKADLNHIIYNYINNIDIESLIKKKLQLH